MITYKRFLLDMANERTKDIDRISKMVGDIYNKLATADDLLLQDIYRRQANAYIDQIEYYGKEKTLYHKLLAELDVFALEQEFKMKNHKYYSNKYKGE